MKSEKGIALLFLPKEGEITMEKANNNLANILYMDPAKYAGFEFTPEQREALLRESFDLLGEFDYCYSRHGIMSILSTFERNKGWIVNVLRKHPNWNEDKLMIVFSTNYESPRNQIEVNNFVNWAINTLEKILPNKEIILHNHPYMEVKSAIRRLSDKRDAVRLVNGYGYTVKETTVDDLNREINRWQKIMDEYQEKADCYWSEAWDMAIRKKREGASEFFRHVRDFNNHIADEEFANAVNATAKEIGIDLRAVSGQKVSRIVSRFAKAIGLDKYVDMGTRHDGTPKDYGWNYHFALFADAVNPIKVTRHTCISVNPIDYWTMSFGHNWRSCHTIDKFGVRGDIPQNHGGGWSSGTESYMLDGASIVFYTVDGSYDGTDFEQQEKMTRCMFHIGEDKIVQGRVYPDGRDGGDQGLAAQYRDIMQRILAECLECDNLWKVEKGTRNIGQYVCSEGTHYQDYDSYNDCTVSLLKKGNGNFNKECFTIGHDPICPNCGEEHSDEEWITCEECRDEGGCHCARCGIWISGSTMDWGEYVRDYDTDNVYCDSICAENDGVYYCDNDNEYHSEDVYWDDRRGEHFYDPRDERVETEDGHTYVDADDAREEGYMEDNDGRWYPESEFRECSHCGQIVHKSVFDEEYGCCLDCLDEVKAEREEEQATEEVA